MLLSAFKNLPNFTDEADNMLAALKIADGGTIYLDYYAHHMPLMYYVLTPFALLGVSSTYAFRLCFYGILALIWAFMYYRYSKYFNKKILVLYPLIYISLMPIDVFYSVLSEQLQAQALAILLLELILFIKNKSLSLSSEIVIALSIFVSIFSVFTSIISVGILALIVFGLELYYYFSNKSKKKENILMYFIHKYYRLAIFIIMPFLIIGLWYIFNGSISEFYRQAFYFNTNVYSKYQSYSNNPVVIIISTICNFIETFKNFAVNSISKLNLNNICILILFMGVIGFLIKEKNMGSLVIVLFTISCGNRSFEGLHALSFYSCAIILSLFFLNTIKLEYSYIPLILFICLYCPYLKVIFNPLINVNEITNSNDFVTIQKITNKTDDVYYLNLVIDDYVNTKRLPAARTMTVFPWFQDLFEEEVLEDLENNKPHVIVYTPTDNVWGYVYQDYLELIDPWIKDNYTYVNQIRVGYTSDLWIRNDYLDEVEKILNIDIPQYNNYYGSKFSLPAVKKVVTNMNFENEHVKNIGLMFNTYDRVNINNLKINLKDENNNIISSETINSSVLHNNTYFYFNVEKNVDLNENYTLEVINEGDDSAYYIGVQAITLKDDTNNIYITVDGIKTQYEPVLTINYN